MTSQRTTLGDPSGAGSPVSRSALRALGWGAAAAAAAAAYMAFEAQWVECHEATLPVAGLPPAWSGLTVLHLSDVHAGVFPTNERSLDKVVRWAAPRSPDLVFLTGDVLGDPARSAACLESLARLEPTLGMFAVTGNHEYGISKGPLARPRDTNTLWETAGITLLCDGCVALPTPGGSGEGSRILLCGADYRSGGFGLLENCLGAGGLEYGPDRGHDPGPEHVGPDGPSGDQPGAGDFFPILLIHEPPRQDSPLARVFPLAFAGHTHGGQLRVPGRRGLAPLNGGESDYLAGVYPWGRGHLVVSRGVGTSFIPFRLLTRPEATLWRLV